MPELIDNAVPSRGYQMTPMIGLGASAGGLQALQGFFREMPHDSGMIFVVILHLSPLYESTMDEILGRVTKMPVRRAEDNLVPLANHVYIIPPGKYLTVEAEHLRLTDLEPEHGKRIAVDLFFRSAADSYGPHATAIVLSGADGDGALGIKRIKERGGLTIAQDPGEAELSGMPQSAMETNMVDWVLGVAEMPRRILDYYRIENVLKLPSEDGPSPVLQQPPSHDDQSESVLREILIFLRMRTGRDFAYYKRATIVRRIARRMQVNSVDDLPGYLTFLRVHPGEAGALLQDLLISVTNFFRDRDIFGVVEKHIPELFADKTPNDTVRIWVPACATGEEAYSMAMLLLEHARSIENPPALQVFACDLDEEAIQVARAGHYPNVITADVSEDRLRRFFVKDHKGYRVRRELREMILFASHDLLKDAPFSRMDLISCRNLLIYLTDEAQRRVFEIFHFALRPGGLLLLGSSESVKEGSPLFRVVDKKNRLYAHQASARSSLPVPSAPSSLFRVMQAQDKANQEGPIVHARRFVHDAAVSFQSRFDGNPDRAALADIHFKLIERLGPPSVVVTSDHEIVHLSEHAGRFLKLVGGEPTNNLLRLVNSDLRIELRTLLFRTMETGVMAEALGVTAVIDGVVCAVDLRVITGQEVAPGFLLITFESREPTPKEQLDASQSADSRTSSDNAVRHMERELEQVKSYLRDTVEQYEASTEELKASNEELQAMNEELRSATEELETSREELQSINEEPSTVNQEMRSNVEELANANSDLQNLMASTSIATVFLDRELVITRFTPSAAGIFNLIPGDIGRPLAHLKHHLEYPELIADAEKVLRTLVPIEREVCDKTRWYFSRIQPYRTAEDHIAGTVLTFFDITERTLAAEALRQSEERMRLLIESAKDFAIFTTDKERTVNSWNSGAETVFGYSEQEVIGRSADILFTPEDREQGDANREMHTALIHGQADNERWHARKDGSIFYGSGMVMPILDEIGESQGFLKIIRDLTESKRTQEALREQMEELKRFNAAAVGRESRMIELKNEVNELCRRLNEVSRYATEGEDSSHK